MLDDQYGAFIRLKKSTAGYFARVAVFPKIGTDSLQFVLARFAPGQFCGNNRR